jgi:MerR family transcriptional regulator/heat shock protein HspR
MTVRYLRVVELCAQLALDESFVQRVCEEGLIEVKRTADDEGVVSADDAERLRLIAILTRDMDVNLAGVEVILHMREDLCAMQRQFDDILHELVGELRRRMER